MWIEGVTDAHEDGDDDGKDSGDDARGSAVRWAPFAGQSQLPGRGWSVSLGGASFSGGTPVGVGGGSALPPGPGFLQSVSEAALSLTAAELAEAFTRQPPACLQPQHANRLRQDSEELLKREAVSRKLVKDRMKATSAVQPEAVDLFLRCYVGAVVPQAPLAALKRFLFSAPPHVAEEHQKEAIAVYEAELKAALSLRRKGKTVSPPPEASAGTAPASTGGGGAPVAARPAVLELRMYITGVLIPSSSELQAARKRDVCPVAVAPSRHFVNEVPQAASPEQEQRVYVEVTMKNPNPSRPLRFHLTSAGAAPPLKPREAAEKKARPVGGDAGRGVLSVSGRSMSMYQNLLATSATTGTQQPVERRVSNGSQPDAAELLWPSPSRNGCGPAAPPPKADDAPPEVDHPQAPAAYDFLVLAQGGELTKKSPSKPVPISAIFRPGAGAGGLREMLILESDYGFRQFVTLVVPAETIAPGAPVHVTGVVFDEGFWVPPALRSYRKALESSGALDTRDLFSLSRVRRSPAPAAVGAPCQSPALPKNPFALADGLLDYVTRLPGGLLGFLTESVVVPAHDALGLAARPAVAPAHQHIVWWLLKFLSRLLLNSRVNGLRGRLAFFQIPAGRLSRCIALHQEATLIVDLMITQFHQGTT
ncbi:hypothetical protein DIPPA_11174 [Diplonema papillatum]|nr:hypothetical protein DIPPA_11174 [Diplonema papillatum]